MKKILIISENPHFTMGGIETYNRELINIFKSLNFLVHEYSFNFNNNPKIVSNKDDLIINLNSNDKKKSRLRKIKEGVKIIDKIIDNYDIVVNSASNIPWTRKIYNSEKIVYVQHFNKNFYYQKYIAGKIISPIIYFGMCVFGIKNPFKKFKKFVFFTENDANQFNLKEGTVYSCIPLAKYSKDEIKKNKKNKINKRNNFMYLGRIDNYQKNIKKMKKYFIKNKIEIDIYGDGDRKIMVNEAGVKFKGFINSSEIGDVFSKYKYNILFSKYEGFPYSIVEALSHGVPTISTNSSCNIRWLTEGKGFIINNKTKKDEIKKQISELNKEYDDVRERCFEFAINNLTKENFKNKWISFIKQAF